MAFYFILSCIVAASLNTKVILFEYDSIMVGGWNNYNKRTFEKCLREPWRIVFYYNNLDETLHFVHFGKEDISIYCMCTKGIYMYICIDTFLYIYAYI